MKYLLFDYFLGNFYYSYRKGSCKEISLEKFLEIVRAAVCGEVYLHNVLQRVKSYMDKFMPDDVNPIKGGVSIIFGPQLNCLGAYLGDLEGRHIIVVRTQLDVCDNPYFDYRRVLEEDAITVAHELAHASHEEVLGGSEFLNNMKRQEILKILDLCDFEIFVRQNFPDIIDNSHFDTDYIYWFLLVEGYATYIELKYINGQVERSFGEERDKWLSLRENFLGTLRVSRKYGDTNTNYWWKLYAIGVLLIHRIHRICHPIPLSSIISLYPPPKKKTASKYLKLFTINLFKLIYILIPSLLVHFH